MVKGTGFGKTILLGEHFVVYGALAIAAGLDRGIRVSLARSAHDEVCDSPFVDKIIESLRIIKKYFSIESGVFVTSVESLLLIGAGLGSSAALAVALARALAAEFDLDKTDDEICAAAYESEKFFHGSPSGIDNTTATYGGLVLFEKRPEHPEGNLVEWLSLDFQLPLVVIPSDQFSSTKDMVERVRMFKQENGLEFDDIFDKYTELASEAKKAIEAGDLVALGKLMNTNQKLLEQIHVSSPILEEIVQVARDNGALGAKLTGKGGGGCAIALCSSSENANALAHIFKDKGHEAFTANVG